MVVKRVKKPPRPKQVEPLPMEPPPPRLSPVREQSEADKKKKLIQLKSDLENKKVYKKKFIRLVLTIALLLIFIKH